MSLQMHPRQVPSAKNAKTMTCHDHLVGIAAQYVKLLDLLH